MDPMVRTLLLVCGVIFVLGFGAMTAAVAADSGFDVFTGAAAHRSAAGSRSLLP